VFESVSKCEKLQKDRRNLKKVAKRRWDKCVKVCESCGVKMEGYGRIGKWVAVGLVGFDFLAPER
jgi:hypothetical protein